MPRACVDDLLRADRILLHGVTGSGKSTAAARLGSIRALPVHLVDDEIGWLPGWVERPQQEQRAPAQAMAAKPRWVIDSAYGAYRDVMLERADVVVALDYPRFISLTRLVRRTVHRVVTRTPMCNQNTESVRQLLSTDSIIAWHFRSFARKRERIREWEAEPDGVAVLCLSRPRELDRLVARMQRSA